MWSRENYSQEVNPEVFTGTYNRELYNAIRQALKDAGARTAVSDGRLAYTMAAYEDYGTVKNLPDLLDGLY